MKRIIVINSLHTVTGGGLVYLQNLLPELAKDERFDWRLVMTTTGVIRLGGHTGLPGNVTLVTAPQLRFGLSHLWEQVVLPWRCWRLGATAVWSNANYGPLLAPRALVTIHTTPRAAAAWPGLKWKVYWSVLRLLTFLCLWRAPAAFSVAQHVLTDYIPTWWPGGERLRKKVTVVPPAVRLTDLPTPVRREPKLLITVGDFYRQKQYPTLLHALKLLRQTVPLARLKIIGRPAFADVVAEVNAVIAELALHDAVEIVPGLPHGELLAALTAAGVYVNLSSAECFNMPVLEALAVGLPVVVGDVDFQKEVVGEVPETAMLVSPLGDQVKDYAAALQQVLADEDLAQRLRVNGPLRAAAFTWEESARKMLDVFTQVSGLKPF